MSPEPKPRSMAAVTIGLTAVVPKQIWLFAGKPEYPPVLAHSWAVTILGVRTISRKGQLERLGELESPETIRRTTVGQQLKRWSGLHGDMQEWHCHSLTFT